MEKHHFQYAHLDYYYLFLTDTKKYTEEYTHSRITLCSHPHHCNILASSPCIHHQVFSALHLTQNLLLSLFQLVTRRSSHGFLSSQSFVTYETRESCLSAKKWGEACRKSKHLFLHSTLLQGKSQSKMDSPHATVWAEKVALPHCKHWATTEKAFEMLKLN